MTIRKVELGDAGAIADIYNEFIEHSVTSFETEPLSEEEMRGRIAEISGEYPYFVCEEDGEIVGYCYAHQWKERKAYANTLETSVYVSPAHTDKGVGTALMQTLIEACRKAGFHALIACVTEGNAASDALHRKLGFRQVSRFEQVGWKFGRWLNVIDYELMLA